MAVIWIISYFNILCMSFGSLSYIELHHVDETNFQKTIGCFIYTILVHIWLFTYSILQDEKSSRYEILIVGLIYYLITHAVGLYVSINLATLCLTNIFLFPIGFFLYFVTLLPLFKSIEEKGKEMKKEEKMTKEELKNWFISKLESLRESENIVDYLDRIEEIKREVKTK